MGIQFRLAEVMVLLCFFKKNYVIGLTLGCAIANLPSFIGVIDVLFGTIATLLACLFIMFCKHLAIACIFPVLFNAFVVGFELWKLWKFLSLLFWISVGEVAIDEFLAMIVGYIFYIIIKRRKVFFDGIKANQNIAFKW